MITRVSKEYMERRAGNIKEMSPREFKDLFELVLWEKARRELSGFRPTHEYTMEFDCVVKSQSDGEEITPRSIEFKRRRVQEHFRV